MGSLKTEAQQVEAVARVFCARNGHDPDEQMPEPGYKVGPPYVPYWKHYEQSALDLVVAFNTLKSLDDVL